MHAFGAAVFFCTMLGLAADQSWVATNRSSSLITTNGSAFPVIKTMSCHMQRLRCFLTMLTDTAPCAMLTIPPITQKLPSADNQTQTPPLGECANITDRKTLQDCPQT